MTAKDYPISFGFKATDGYYYGPSGVVGPFHHGIDYGCPSGTPVVISGVTISHSGATGTVSAAHLHVDKRPIGRPITDRNSFVDPSGWWNITGTVVFAGNAGTAGNMVSIHSGGYEYRFLHNSTINVSVGQVISPQQGGGQRLVDRGDLDAIYQYGPLGRQRGPGEGEDVYLGRTANYVILDHFKSNEAQTRRRITEEVLLAKDNAINNLNRQVNQMQRTINELSTRPTKESLDNAVSAIQTNLKKAEDALVKEKEETDRLKKELEVAQSRETVPKTEYSFKGIVNWFVELVNKWRAK